MKIKICAHNSAPLRDIRDSAWCWQAKNALEAILEVSDGRDGALPISVYVALTWIGSDYRSQEFEVTISEISKRAGCCYRSVAKAFAALEAAGVIARQVQRIPGSKLQKASIYRLLAANPLGTSCPTLGTLAEDATVPRSSKEDEEITEKDKQPPVGLEALSASDAERARGSDDEDLLTAMAKVCGANPDEMTKSGRHSVRQALKEIAAVTRNLSPEEIGRRAAIFATRFPKLSLTASALARHWASCGSAPRTEQPVESVYVEIKGP